MNGEREPTVPFYKNRGAIQTANHWENDNIASFMKWVRYFGEPVWDMTGWSITKATFLLRELIEKFREKRNSMHMVFMT